MRSREKIGILGGSFNTPHLGHVGICRHLLKEGRVNRVFVVPCFQHPFGKSLEAFSHRFRMSRLAFKKFGGKVAVLDVEKKLGGKSTTWRTLRAIQKKYPAFELILIVGKDVFRQRRSWHCYDKLKKTFKWCVVPRGPRSPIPDISATAIRKGLRCGQVPAQSLPKEVVRYIRRHCLYSTEITCL